MPNDKVKQVLAHHFKQVPGLVELYLVRSRNRAELQLYARLKDGRNPDVVSEPAFEAFRDAIDELMRDAPSSSYITWYGFLEREPKDKFERILL